MLSSDRRRGLQGSERSLSTVLRSRLQFAHFLLWLFVLLLHWEGYLLFSFFKEFTMMTLGTSMVSEWFIININFPYRMNQGMNHCKKMRNCSLLVCKKKKRSPSNCFSILSLRLSPNRGHPLSGSFDYVERLELLELLRIRTASYSGFFARHFSKDKPTPKQYFALTHAVEFLAENGFCREGDERPMETLHHEWNRLWVKSRHCVQRKMPVEHCLNSMHVKNNVKILLLADKAQC